MTKEQTKTLLGEMDKVVETFNKQMDEMVQKTKDFSDELNKLREEDIDVGDEEHSDVRAIKNDILYDEHKESII